ncbi:RHS repeat protein, partial [Vibrio paucivorans]
MNDISKTSNASNFSEFISAGVDPRTGTYSATIVLGTFIGHRASGPQFNLSLVFTPSSSVDNGFGRGWSMPSGFYESDMPYDRLALPSGQSFQLEYDFSQEKYTIPYRRLMDIDVLLDEENKELIVVEKNGEKDVFDTEYGYLKRRVGQTGLIIEFEFALLNQQWVLSKISDGHGREVNIDYWSNEYSVTVEHLFNDEIYQSFAVNKTGYGASGYRLDNVMKVDSSGAPLQVSQFEYAADEFTGADLISSVVFPTGMTDIVYYDDTHSTPEGFPVEKIRRVSRWDRQAGENQPDCTREYTYSANNYLGNGSGNIWQSGEDPLFNTNSDYRYECTEVITGYREVRHVYNKFHLPEVIEYSKGGSVYLREESIHFADLNADIAHQPPHYTLVKEQRVTHFHDGQSQVVSSLYDYDDHGNLTYEEGPDGAKVILTYYPAEGEEGNAPANPHGFVSLLKQETHTPVSTENGEQERSIVHYYLSLPRLDDGEPFALLSQQDNHDHNLVMSYYDNNELPLEYGRLKSESLTVNEYTSVDTFSYEFLDTGLKTLQHHLAHDGLALFSSQTVAYTDGQVTESINPEGIVVCAEYDALGRVVKKSVSPETEYEANTRYYYETGDGNNAITVTDAKENSVVQHLNNAGQVVRIEMGDADGILKLVNQCNYDALGQMTQETVIDWLDGSPLSLTRSYDYDPYGETSKVVHPNGIVELSEQNRATLTATHQIEGLLTETTVFNLSGQEVQKESRDNTGNRLARTAYTYDGWGNTLTVTDTAGHVTTMEYDESDRLTVTKRTIDGQPVQETLRYQKHTLEALPDEIDVNTTVLGERTYDGLNRKVWETGAGGTKQWSYSGASSLPSGKVTPTGDHLTFTNNPHLLKVTAVEVAGDPSLSATYTYDSITGSVLDCLNQGANISLSYNRLGQLVSETTLLNDFSTRTATYSYSLDGRLLSRTDFFGNTTRFTYDSAGRPSEVTTAYTDRTSQASIVYDAFSRPGTITTDDGTNTVTIELVYNALGRESLRTVNVEGEVQSSLSIEQSYNEDMQVSQKVYRDADGTTVEDMQYDDLHRLTHYMVTGPNAPSDQYGNVLREQQFEYDVYGNITRVESYFSDGTGNIMVNSYAPDNLVQLANQTNTHPDYPATIDFNYDDAGNLLTDDLEEHRYRYNALGQMSHIDTPNGDEISRYQYDATGRVVSQTLDGQLLYLYYQGSQLVNELSDGVYSSYQSMSGA